MKGSTRESQQPLSFMIVAGVNTFTNTRTYNVKSGVGIVIVKETKDWVRNKYCTVCNAAAKGYTFSTVDRYHPERIYSLRRTVWLVLCYTKFIGDVDSSVFPALISGVPNGRYIKELECANHAIKCHHTALENLSLSTKEEEN